MRLPCVRILGVTLVLSGCVTASVESRPLSPEELTSPGKGQTLEGVIFYLPRPYLLTYLFTQYDPAAQKPPGPGAPTDSCARTIQRTELQVMPDFAHPRLLVPSRDGIGTAKLSVTLSNGMITAVNADGSSTLADVLKAVTGGVADLATVGKLVETPGGYARRCNTGAVLASIEPVDWSKLPRLPARDSVAPK
jgi:hypothetical protein